MQDVAIQSPNMEDLISLVKKSFPEKTILFDFWNESCSPCLIQHKILQQIEDNSDLIVYKVNIGEDENFEFAKQNNITTLPTLIIFKHNKPFSFVGLTNLDDISFFLQSDPNLCINCKKLNYKKSNQRDFYYCKKHKIYIYFKDSC